MNAQLALLVACETRRTLVAREPSSIELARIARHDRGGPSGFRTVLARLAGRTTPAAPQAR